MPNKKTLLIGASENPQRYSNMAIRSLRQHRHEVLAIGNGTGTVADVHFTKERPGVRDIDTVTLYLAPARQKEYYDYILGLQPRRIIFNPGTENPELGQLAEAKGIKIMEACTLVLLHTGQY
ncbi:MAG: CoA-binding protein [Edaphocola sp.]